MKIRWRHASRSLYDFFGGDYRLDYSRTRFFRQYINKKPTKPAGAAYDYNNSNYNLLAWIIEHVSGRGMGSFCIIISSCL